MPGQCYGCGAQFGVFKKEHGCKNCGFAFCSKCLHEKTIPVPKRNNAKHHVCVKCYKLLSGQEQKESGPVQYDLPEAYLKRVAALNDKGGKGAQAPARPHPSAQPQQVSAHLRTLDKADRDIALRLERLKESNKPKEKVSDADLNSRLANLKGQTHVPDKKPAYQAPDRRTQVEQVDDLLDEIAAEVDIDSHAPDHVKDVEARLAHLHYGEGPKTEKNESDQGDANPSSSTSATKPTSGPTVPASSSSGDGNEVNMEEMQRLMEVTAKELEIDAQRALDGMKKDKELMDRLAEIQKRKDAKKADGGDNEADQEQSDAMASSQKLIEGGLSVDTHDDIDSESESEDVAARKIIQRYLVEAKIDEKIADLPPPGESTEREDRKKQRKARDSKTDSETAKRKTRSGGDDAAGSDYDDSDELPYCCICTEDAVIRCKDCSWDLYCQRCFRECHKKMGLDDHVKIPYKAPKGYK